MKRLMRISLCFFVLFAIITMGLVSRSVYLNYKLRDGFKPKEDAYPYGEEVEKGTLDLDEISYLLCLTAHSPIAYNIYSLSTVYYFL